MRTENALDSVLVHQLGRNGDRGDELGVAAGFNDLLRGLAGVI